jgi:hypothetical protein
MDRLAALLDLLGCDNTGDCIDRCGLAAVASDATGENGEQLVVRRCCDYVHRVSSSSFWNLGIHAIFQLYV